VRRGTVVVEPFAVAVAVVGTGQLGAAAVSRSAASTEEEHVAAQDPRQPAEEAARTVG